MFFFLFWLPGCSGDTPPSTENFSYLVVNSYPHDPKAFTQGLVWDRNSVFEGTGKRGRSSLRKVELFTGKVLKQIDHEQSIFAEGITVFKNRIYQLTWKNNIVFVYDRNDFSQIKSYPYPREGWGITHNNHHLIVSDGTPTLYFLDPDTLNNKGKITVHDNSGPIKYINELEYIKGRIYANVWKSNRIAIIHPDTGFVTGWIDLSGLANRLKYNHKPDVLNGIMYDSTEDRLFVTGKFWPTLFEIKLVHGVK